MQLLSRALVALAAIALFVPLNARAASLRIVVLGDSLVAGPGLRHGEAFPEALERRLRASGRDVAITNAGVSGDTAANGLARMDWSIPDGTDLVIVELGANDMLRGHDPNLTRQTLDAVFRRVKERGMALVIAGMRAINNYGPEYQREFDAIYPALAKEHGVPLFPFFMDGIFGHTEFLLPDRLHPSAAGVNEMVERFLPFITPIVDVLAREKQRGG